MRRVVPPSTQIILEHFPQSREKPHAHHSPRLLPPAPANTSLRPASVDVPILDVLRKWKRKARALVCPASSTRRASRRRGAGDAARISAAFLVVAEPCPGARAPRLPLARPPVDAVWVVSSSQLPYPFVCTFLSGRRVSSSWACTWERNCRLVR